MADRRLGWLEIAALVVMGLIVATVALMIWGNDYQRRVARRMRNEAWLWQIGRSELLYASEHGDRFPQAGVGTTTGNSAAARFQELATIAHDSLEPAVLINPLEQIVKTRYAGSGTLTTANFSYALLAAGNPEWRNSLNSETLLCSDRLLGGGSLWNSRRWEGDVLWGDTHVSYQKGRTMRTVMWSNDPDGATTQPARVVRTADDIFSGSDGGAMMEYN